jgi:hypothetical protein
MPITFSPEFADYFAESDMMELLSQKTARCPLGAGLLCFQAEKLIQAKSVTEAHNLAAFCPQFHRKFALFFAGKSSVSHTI